MISDDAIETINLIDGDVPFADLATDAPKKVKIITDPNRIRLAFNRIMKKYQRQRQKGSLKKSNKKATKWLKKVGFLRTDNWQTTDYNNDVSVNDIETVDFNNNTQMRYVNDVGLKRTSVTQQAAKKISKNMEI